MPKEMTSERAIIILDSLNTDGRIEVNRDELRAAVKVAKEALRKQIPEKVNLSNLRLSNTVWWNCPSCGTLYNIQSEEDKFKHCDVCGQALDWGAEFPHKAKLFGIWSDDDGR